MDTTLSTHDAQRAAKSVRWISNKLAFVLECCYTFDEVGLEVPIKRLPNLPHIHHIVDKWNKSKILVIPKSRRMQVTWTLCMLDLHTAMYQEQSVVFLISKDQGNSDKLVSRCRFLYDNLPDDLVKPRMKYRLGKSGDVTRIDFLETGSRIEALSQDPNKIRQEGATLLHVEEMAFWEWPEETYKAMLPTIQGGGKLVIASSAQANTLLGRIVFDELGRAVV